MHITHMCAQYIHMCIIYGIYSMYTYINLHVSMYVVCMYMCMYMYLQVHTSVHMCILHECTCAYTAHTHMCAHVNILCMCMCIVYTRMCVLRLGRMFEASVDPKLHDW